MIFQTYNCNCEFLESMRIVPKLLDFKIKNSIPFSNISKHTRYYVEFFQNSIIASTRAVFQRDIIVFLAKVISAASGPMQVDPI